MWLYASVLCLFLTVPRVGLQCVIVEFPGHIPFWISLLVRLAWNTSNEATAMAGFLVGCSILGYYEGVYLTVNSLLEESSTTS